MPTRIFKRNDRKLTPWARLLDEAGAPIDLTGSTVVYTLQVTSTGLNKIARAPAVVRNQVTAIGEIFYQFTALDVDTALEGTEEWEVSWADGLKETFPSRAPVRVVILPDLDAV